MKWWLVLPLSLDAGAVRLVSRPERCSGQFVALLGDKLGDAQEAKASRAPRVTGRGRRSGLGRREEGRAWRAANVSAPVAPQDAPRAPSQEGTLSPGPLPGGIN